MFVLFQEHIGGELFLLGNNFSTFSPGRVRLFTAEVSLVRRFLLGRFTACSETDFALSFSLGKLPGVECTGKDRWGCQGSSDLSNGDVVFSSCVKIFLGGKK